MSILLDDVRAIRAGLGKLDALLGVDNHGDGMEFWRPVRDQSFFVQTRTLTDLECARVVNYEFEGTLQTPKGRDMIARLFRDHQGFEWRDAYDRMRNVYGLFVASAAEPPSDRVGELHIGDVLIAYTHGLQCLGVVEKFQVLG